MTRELQVVDSADPSAVFEALRAALAGGPAVLPREGGDIHPSSRRVAQNVALVVETSGSTGSPKRVALSTDALLASAAASAGAMGGQGQWLLALPAHYVAGAQVLVRSIAAETEPVSLRRGALRPAALRGRGAPADPRPPVRVARPGAAGPAGRGGRGGRSAGRGCAAPIRRHPRGRPGADARPARAGARRGSAHPDHLRLQRDGRRMRLRRRADRHHAGARGRRAARDRRAGARRRLPRRP